MKRLAEEDDAVRLVSFDDEAYVRFTVTRGGCFRGVPPSLWDMGVWLMKFSLRRTLL